METYSRVLAVERALRQHKDPVEVMEICRVHVPTLGASKVLWVLGLLAEQGVVRRVKVSGRYAWQHVPGTRWVKPEIRIKATPNEGSVRVGQGSKLVEAGGISKKVPRVRKP